MPGENRKSNISCHLFVELLVFLDLGFSIKRPCFLGSTTKRLLLAEESMGFLNRFFTEVFDESPLFKTMNSSFDAFDPSQLEAHLEVNQYDSFELTNAVRPALDLKIRPTQGYRHDVYVDKESNTKVPVIMAAASRDTLFPLFMQLIQRLGPVVDVVLETSHQQSTNGQHIDLYREHIDMPVLTSILWEFEDLLTNDGCTGIAVLNPNTPQEIQFDEHKLLIIYGSPLEPFEFTLESNGVQNKEDIRFITEAEHVHSSTESFQHKFEELRTELGLDGDHHIEQEDDLFGV